MPRYPSSGPTDVELQILGVLWERGPMTVRQVHQSLSCCRDTGYSTTLKMLQVMREKGLVVRDDTVRPQRYRASKGEKQTQLQMLDEFVRKAFGGSAEKLVMRMLSARRVSMKELAEMQRLIEQAKTGDRP